MFPLPYIHNFITIKLHYGLWSMDKLIIIITYSTHVVYIIIYNTNIIISAVDLYSDC